jgi:hypothetical protein
MFQLGLVLSRSVMQVYAGSVFNRVFLGSGESHKRRSSTGIDLICSAGRCRTGLYFSDNLRYGETCSIENNGVAAIFEILRNEIIKRA